LKQLRRRVALDESQHQELTNLRNTAPKAYLRERCAAILKIAGGISAYKVATSGLLRKRAPDTVYDWLNRYQEHGLAGLYIKEGRGRKPAFSPSVPKQ